MCSYYREVQGEKNQSWKSGMHESIGILKRKKKHPICVHKSLCSDTSGHVQTDKMWQWAPENNTCLASIFQRPAEGKLSWTTRLEALWGDCDHWRSQFSSY